VPADVRPFALGRAGVRDRLLSGAKKQGRGGGRGGGGGGGGGFHCAGWRRVLPAPLRRKTATGLIPNHSRSVESLGAIGFGAPGQTNASQARAGLQPPAWVPELLQLLGSPIRLSLKVAWRKMGLVPPASGVRNESPWSVLAYTLPASCRWWPEFCSSRLGGPYDKPEKAKRPWGRRSLAPRAHFRQLRVVLRARPVKAAGVRRTFAGVPLTTIRVRPAGCRTGRRAVNPRSPFSVFRARSGSPQ